MTDAAAARSRAADHDDIERRFNHHPPDKQRVLRHEAARGLFRGLAHQVIEDLPPGRERSLVIMHLEQGLFWANAAIAREGR